MENTYLNDDDDRIIKNITFTILLSLRRYLANKQNNNINLAKEYLGFLRSQKRFSEAALTVNLSELAEENGLNPEQINKKLAKFLKKESDLYLKSPNLSKTLNLLDKDEIFKKFERIDNIKREFPKRYTRGRSKSKKRPGYPSIFKLTDKVKDYQRVLNNPDALHRINQDLLSFDDTLIVFYRTAVNDFFDLIIDNGNPKIYEFSKLSFNSLVNIDNFKLTGLEDWNRFREALSELNNEERQKLVNDTASYYSQNPQQLMFLIFALDKENMTEDKVD